MPSERKPQTPREWALYRAKLSCKCGRDVVSGEAKSPPGVMPMEWAMFNLLHAVEDIARAMGEGSAGQQ